MTKMLTAAMQKKALIFAVILFLSASAVFAQESEALEPNCQNVTGVPFQFCSGKDFNSDSLAEAAQPKAWSADDILKFNIHLMPLLNSKKLTNFFKKIQANHMIRLYRYGYGFSGSQGVYSRVPTVMMQANAKNKMIVVTDRYLNYSLKDPLGNFDRADLTMLHEFTHALDGADYRYSTSDEFIKITGFTNESGAWKLQGLPQNINDSLQRYMDFLSRGNLLEAFSLSRGTSVKLGLSSFAVISMPQEFLAETAATIYFDPNASNYLKPEIINWFEKNILN